MLLRIAIVLPYEVEVNLIQFHYLLGHRINH